MQRLLICGVVPLALILSGGIPAAANALELGPPAVLSNTVVPTDSSDDYLPEVTTDGEGNWVVVWYSYDSLGGTISTDEDILVSRSRDAGETWTAPAALNTNAASDSGRDYSPQVTTDGAGNWVAVWRGNDSLGATIGADYDIFVSRSTDAGLTWTAPVALNTNAASDSESDQHPQVTTDGAGNWLAVWRSKDSLGETIGTDEDILVSRSTDAGITWTAPVVVNTNAASDSGRDWNPQVTTDGAGNWVVAWVSNDSLSATIGTDDDILVSRSTDTGMTWVAPVALNTNAASDSGDEYFPQVTTDGAGNWVAVWQSTDDLGGTIGTDLDIVLSRSTDAGLTWTAPVALNTNAASDSGWDRKPQVTEDGSGDWVAVWTSPDRLGGALGTDYDILVSHSTDTGVTWTAPVALNTNAETDSGDDHGPQVATDGSGNWVAVWYSRDSLGGTASDDAPDIFVAVGDEGTETSTATQTATATRTPTETPGSSPTETSLATRTETPIAPDTPTQTTTPVSTVTGTPTGGVATPTVTPCVGDCNGDSTVTVDELIRGVNIALGSQLVDTCASFDVNSDSAVTVDELIRGVNAALGGCLA